MTPATPLHTIGPVGEEPAGTSPFEGPWPEGEDLIGVGGALEPELVLEAYRHGVFPWYSHGQPPLWWCPDPRAVLPLDGMNVSRRLQRTLRGRRFEIRVNTQFEEVMRECGRRRPEGTWIHGPMVDTYVALHRAGHAHSVEVWRGDDLVGGTYGVAFGSGFAADSMFHRERDASKVALAYLVGRLRERGFTLLDVQMLTPHLERMGCVEIARERYLAAVRAAVRSEARFA